MNEQQFHDGVDALFFNIETWLETLSIDLDFESNEGILTIMLADGNKIILSRQSAMQEIWLASSLGAHHFRFIEGHWQTQKGLSLLKVLATILVQNADVPIDLNTFKS